MNQTKYWDDFYSHGLVLEPSNFAKWVQTFFDLENFQLLDWGCGNGRDGLFLSKFADNLVMLDSSVNAISFIRGEIDKRRITNAIAQVFDVNNVNNSVDFVTRDVLHYARFFLHAIDDLGLINFFNHLSKFASKSESSFAVFEYRVEEDSENLFFIYGDHSRWLRDPSMVVQQMLICGWKLRFEHIGRDLAVFKDENPLIARQVFEYLILEP